MKKCRVGAEGCRTIAEGCEMLSVVPAVLGKCGKFRKDNECVQQDAETLHMRGMRCETIAQGCE